MQGTDQGQAGELDGEGLRIGIVRARFNDAITARVGQACLAELERLGVEAGDVSERSVPGALETPAEPEISRQIVMLQRKAGRMGRTLGLSTGWVLRIALDRIIGQLPPGTFLAPEDEVAASLSDPGYLKISGEL